ncbi:hypothetical protein [Engelhardtia mirabilis]|uniref:Lipoprotein n=1 Tax=Engelhardtia mirabilis TaxID=2528011 RepID=A0A518BM60_9BACT|nr:hypothetical protein Pla133_31520 [Planctomycetes bacterium Pla133]QDV02386.1 hypothetical protein Pla86_31510 [Planctomycetes bacterium Pla86]
MRTTILGLLLLASCAAWHYDVDQAASPLATDQRPAGVVPTVQH